MGLSEPVIPGEPKALVSPGPAARKGAGSGGRPPEAAAGAAAAVSRRAKYWGCSSSRAGPL
jgi:hypothetical protein